MQIMDEANLYRVVVLCNQLVSNVKPLNVPATTSFLDGQLHL